jgi:hypothetical protein
MKFLVVLLCLFILLGSAQPGKAEPPDQPDSGGSSSSSSSPDFDEEVRQFQAAREAQEAAEAAAAAAAGNAEARRPGRPPGSKNKVKAAEPEAKGPCEPSSSSAGSYFY